MEHSQTTIRPVTENGWLHHWDMCCESLRELNDGDGGERRQLHFYIPEALKQLLLLYSPDRNFITLLCLLSDLYMSKLNNGGICIDWISTLETEANIVAALETHLRDTIDTQTPGFANIEETVKVLIQSMDELLHYPKIELEEIDIGGGITESPHATYFLACIIHPEIDSEGNNSEWLKVLLRQRPSYIDATEAHDSEQDLNTEERFPELGQMLRESLVSEGEDFVDFFKVFGRWTFQAADDLWKEEKSREKENWFVQKIARELPSTLSPVSLSVRTAISNTNLRRIYRAMINQGTQFIISDHNSLTMRVMCYRLYRWVLACAMSAHLEPQDRSRISSWMHRSGLDQALTTNYPIDVLLLGQTWCLATWLAFQRNVQEEQEVDQESEEFEDVEFEPIGLRLDPLMFASRFTEKHNRAEDICIICQEELWDGSEQEVEIDTCGHLVHEYCLDLLINGIDTWSNKCPACRQEICPPRDKKASFDESDSDDGADLDGDEVDDEGAAEVNGNEAETNSGHKYEMT